MDHRERARQFLQEEQAFRLGVLPTESSHPATHGFGATVRQDLSAGLRQLQAVDQDLPPVAARVLGSEVFARLVKELAQTWRGGGRVYFSGCGATGRLSILLETAWRRFWRRLRELRPSLAARYAGWDDRVVSVMAGDDFALIRSVEGFEDFTDFGRVQLREAGVRPWDVLVAITEGGETSFVIGTVWEALAAGAQAFFVFNNPAATLCQHVVRSRQVIEEPRVHGLDLATGPMAIRGSTRMQATTIELLVVGAAVECALGRLLGEDILELGLTAHETAGHAARFSQLLDELRGDAATQAAAGAVAFEQRIYEQRGRVTYVADRFMLDVLTDTTERAPTFMLPPFRPLGDTVSPVSWAFIKHPLLPTSAAWARLLEREPRGLPWREADYQRLGAPAALCRKAPALDRAALLRFAIGNEPDATRTDCAASALILVMTADERSSLGADHPFMQAARRLSEGFGEWAEFLVGEGPTGATSGTVFHAPCSCPPSPLELWSRLGLKLFLNTVSTATMARLGRVEDNAMVWVSPSNKKLVDRGTRLIAEQTGLSYDAACEALFAAIAVNEAEAGTGRELPSPVARAIAAIREQRPR